MMWNEIVNANCSRASSAASKSMAAPRNRTLPIDIRRRRRLEQTGSVQRLLDREEIAPREAFLERRAQQIGRMEGRECADLARAGWIGEPAAARALDPLPGAEQRL